MKLGIRLEEEPGNETREEKPGNETGGRRSLGMRLVGGEPGNETREEEEPGNETSWRRAWE